MVRVTNFVVYVITILVRNNYHRYKEVQQLTTKSGATFSTEDM